MGSIFDVKLNNVVMLEKSCNSSTLLMEIFMTCGHVHHAPLIQSPILYCVEEHVYTKTHFFFFFFVYETSWCIKIKNFLEDGRNIFHPTGSDFGREMQLDFPQTCDKVEAQSPESQALSSS